MKPFRTLLPFLLITLTMMAYTPAQAAPKLQEVKGAVMSAETNKPVAGAEVSFFSRNDKGMAAKPAAKTKSDSEGAYHVKLPSGSFAWFVKAEGLGTMQSGTSVANKPVELNTVYLRKPAELTGRVVNGAGAPVAGVAIRADKFTTANSGSDGRFRLTGLDPHGYEPASAKAGWVLEKSAYYYLSPGETKDMGDLMIRRAATLKVHTSVREKGKIRTIDNIRINLSGNSLYRSVKADKKGLATLTDLPPGRYAVSAPDERLTNARREVEIEEGKNSEITLECELKPPTLSIEEYSEVFLPDKPVKLRANSLRVDKGEAVVSLISADGVLNGSIDLRKPDAIPVGALKKVATIPVPFKSRRDSHSRFGRIPLPGLQPGAYLLELKGNRATARFAFLVTRLGLVAKTAPSGTLLFATDLVNGKQLSNVEIKTLSGTSGVTTGTDGLVQWSGAAGAARLVGKSGSSLAFLDLPSRERGGEATGLKGYIYTDRPAYRPNQTVFYKGVLRQRDGEGYRLPSLGTVHVAVKDDNDKSICEADLGVSASGSFTGECALPAVPALGDYSITATGGSESWQGWFRVLEYRKRRRTAPIWWPAIPAGSR